LRCNDALGCSNKHTLHLSNVAPRRKHEVDSLGLELDNLSAVNSNDAVNAPSNWKLVLLQALR